MQGPTYDLGYGTPDPLVPVRTDPLGRWAAFCQARRDTNGDGEVRLHLGMHGDLLGDQPELYLATPNAPRGQPIEQLVGASSDGDHVVIESGGRTLLLSPSEGSLVDLGVSASRGRDRAVRAVSFGEQGSSLAYIKGPPETERIVVRDLETGSERRLPPVSGRIWQMGLLGTGKLLVVAVITEDTHQDGQLDSRLQPSRSTARCKAPAMIYSSFGFREDRMEHRVLRTTDGDVVAQGHSLVAWDRDRLVRRDAGGELRWVLPSGETEPLAPSTCGGALLALDAEHRTAWVACASEADPAPTALFRDGERMPLSFTRHIDHTTPAGWTAQRIAVAWSADGGHLVDLATGRSFSRAAHEEAFRGSRVLESLENGALRLRDLSDNTSQILTGPMGGSRFGRQISNRWVAVWTGDHASVVDMAEGRLSGSLPALPLAVTSDGYALIASSRNPWVAKGPLKWLRMHDDFRWDSTGFGGRVDRGDADCGGVCRESARRP